VVSKNSYETRLPAWYVRAALWILFELMKNVRRTLFGSSLPALTVCLLCRPGAKQTTSPPAAPKPTQSYNPPQSKPSCTSTVNAPMVSRKAAGVGMHGSNYTYVFVSLVLKNQ